MLLLKLHLFFGWNHVAPQRRVSVPSGLRLICATDLHNCPTVEMFPHKHEYEKCNLFWVDPTYTITPRAPRIKDQRITHSGLFWSVNVSIYGSICESVANGYFAWVKLCLYVYVLAELHCILCPNGPAKYLNLTLSSLIYCCLHSPYWKKSTNLGRPICILYKLTAQCERLLIIKFLIF